MFHVLHRRWIQLNIQLGQLAKARQHLQQHIKAQKNTTAHPTIYTDLSVISMNDAGTGIQRLVKSVWKRLDAQTNNPPFVALYATRKKRYALSKYPQKNIKKRQYVNLKQGDLFFGLDWSADQIIRHQRRLMKWKMQGAKCVFILNDILALQHPEWFTKKNSQKLAAWLKVISVCADEIVCVSKTVQTDVEQWLKAHDIHDLPCSSIRLGGEIDPPAQSAVRAGFHTQFLAQPFVLKVSTVEPRKGHLYVVKAFEALLNENPDYPQHLFLVGRYGWKADAVTDYIRNSAYFGTRIFWFDDINDAELALLYQHASGVINASLGEGFGLPLMEAIQYQKPLLVRDLAVFREVTSNQADYFVNDNPAALAQTIYDWSVDLNANSHAKIPLTSWDETTQQLLAVFKRHSA